MLIRNNKVNRETVLLPQHPENQKQQHYHNKRNAAQCIAQPGNSIISLLLLFTALHYKQQQCKQHYYGKYEQ